eukprot:612318-Ditylum_brightwellii.AAC.1
MAGTAPLHMVVVANPMECTPITMAMRLIVCMAMDIMVITILQICIIPTSNSDQWIMVDIMTITMGKVMDTHHLMGNIRNILQRDGHILLRM